MNDTSRVSSDASHNLQRHSRVASYDPKVSFTLSYDFKIIVTKMVNSSFDSSCQEYTFHYRRLTQDSNLERLL